MMNLIRAIFDTFIYQFMSWVLFAYIALVIVATGLPAMWREGFWFGLAGILTPLLAVMAGSGIATGRHDPSRSIWATVGIGGAILGASLFWTDSAGWHVRLGGSHFSGILWCLMGFGIGLLSMWKEGESGRAKRIFA